MDAANALASLGFTGLESEIYAFLLAESPASGYRIAQAIHKPAANVYKALQTLESKGATLGIDGSPKQFVPVPKHDLLARLGRDFERRRAEALACLPDGRVAVMSVAPTVLTGPAVTGRAVAMIDEAVRIVLGAVGSPVSDALGAALAAAGDRGIDAAVVTVERDAVCLVADGAALVGNSVRAIWTSDSSIISALVPSLAAHQGFAEIGEREDGVGAKRLQRVVARVRELGG